MDPCKALLRIYKDLEMKCGNKGCGDIIRLGDFHMHLSRCINNRCENFELCQNYMKDGALGVACLLTRACVPQPANFT